MGDFLLELLKYLIGGGAPTAVILLIVFYCYPDQFQKWIGFFSRAFNYIWKSSEYFSIKNEVEGKLNTFASNLECHAGVPYSKIKIIWTSRNEEEKITLEDWETVIVTRDRRGRNKNFVHAAYFYTSNILLKPAKRFLSKHLQTSLDLFTTKKILELDNPQATEQFFGDYFVPHAGEHEEIFKYIQKFTNIDKLNLFFPILIQELFYLGKKVFLSRPNEQIIGEIKGLINYLEKWSNRPVGSRNVPEEFCGKYMKCSIKIVATAFSRQLNLVDSQARRLSKIFSQGYENIYVMGGAEKESKKFINDVVQKTLKTIPNLEKVRNKEFVVKIIKDGIRTKIQNYFVHIHNPCAVEHIVD